MTTTITMPALSPTMEEGTLAKWHVKPGDSVKAGQIIAEIETDKATMDLEAVDEGVIGKLLVAEGAAGVKVNAPIAEMQGEGEAAGKQTNAKVADASPPPRSGGGGEARSAETEGAVAKASSVSAAPGPPPSRGTRDNEVKSPPVAAGQRIKASPLARRLASAKGVDLAALKGSGPHGRIIKVDIERAQPGAAKASGAPASAGLTSLIEPAVLDDRVYAPDSYELIPLDAVRRVTARRLTQSFMQVPHFPLEIDLQIDHLLAARKAINEALGDKGKISVNDMLIKAAALALMAQPDTNASFTDKGVARHKSAHVSMAVAIEGGLITPVIRDAQTKGLAQIAAETKDLAARARERKLKPQEYMGGTFSISNLGMFGIKSFGSILNPPEGMILSVGEGAPRAVVKDGKIEIATILSVTLTCDHRVVDGATGAKWLQHFRQFVETPESMLL